MSSSDYNQSSARKTGIGVTGIRHVVIRVYVSFKKGVGTSRADNARGHRRREGRSRFSHHSPALSGSFLSRNIGSAHALKIRAPHPLAFRDSSAEEDGPPRFCPGLCRSRARHHGTAESRRDEWRDWRRSASEDDQPTAGLCLLDGAFEMGIDRR